MVNFNFYLKNHILPDYYSTLAILEIFAFVLCSFWLVNYVRHCYLLNFTILDEHFFFIELQLIIFGDHEDHDDENDVVK